MNKYSGKNNERGNKKGNDQNRQAIALTYRAPSAPKIVAKGFDDLADEIIQLAQEYGVLMHQDNELAQFLSQLDIGESIPREVYVIIAELISWSYIIRGLKPDKWNNIHNRIDQKI